MTARSTPAGVRATIDSPWWLDVPSASVDSLLADLDARGFATVGGFLSADEVEHLRCVAADAAERNGGRYTEIAADDDRSQPMLDAIGHAPEFRSLCRRLVGLGTGHIAPPVRFTRVFRCQAGSAGRRRTMRFRFASHLLTVLIPIALPGPTGELWMFPNVRHLRRRYSRHFADRLLWQNGPTEILLRLAARRGWFGLVRVPLEPGRAVVFWGYRTLHAERLAAASGLGAAILFHYANPHGRSRARHLLRAAHLRPELAAASRS